MTSINILNIKDNCEFTCTTLGELLDSFNVKLNYFMNEKKKSFPVSESEDEVFFYKYDILQYYYNNIHIFYGLNNNYTRIVLLDIRHQLIYSSSIIEENIIIRTYTLDGDFINSYEFENDNINIKTIVPYLKRDYLCYNIGELIDAFNLDIKLSNKLRNHIIISKEDEECEYCCGKKVLFSDYYITVIDDVELYVFESMFDNETIILDSEAPTYYVDPKKQHIYMETKGMVGNCILEFDENNIIVENAHSWIIDMEMFLKLTSTH